LLLGLYAGCIDEVIDLIDEVTNEVNAKMAAVANANVRDKDPDMNPALKKPRTEIEQWSFEDFSILMKRFDLLTNLTLLHQNALFQIFKNTFSGKLSSNINFQSLKPFFIFSQNFSQAPFDTFFKICKQLL